jgi:hypothetical protein
MNVRGGHGNLMRLVGGLEVDAEELAERPEFGDNESILAWFRRRYPIPIDRLVTERRWGEFLAIIRELYEDDRDG